MVVKKTRAEFLILCLFAKTNKVNALNLPVSTTDKTTKYKEFLNKIDYILSYSESGR